MKMTVMPQWSFIGQSDHLVAQTKTEHLLLSLLTIFIICVLLSILHQK